MWTGVCYTKHATTRLGRTRADAILILLQSLPCQSRSSSGEEPCPAGCLRRPFRPPARSNKNLPGRSQMPAISRYVMHCTVVHDTRMIMSHRSAAAEISPSACCGTRRRNAYREGYDCQGLFEQSFPLPVPPAAVDSHDMVCPAPCLNFNLRLTCPLHSSYRPGSPGL